MENIDVKVLRQRLGWSAAELARRLGTQVEKILAWENGQGVIAIETLHELQALANFVDSNAHRVASQPVAEVLLRDLGVEQIVTDEVLKLQDTDPT
jgi:transcriptional regulator with XRE-family HTH domain